MKVYTEKICDMNEFWLLVLREENSSFCVYATKIRSARGQSEILSVKPLSVSKQKRELFYFERGVYKGIYTLYKGVGIITFNDLGLMQV